MPFGFENLDVYKKAVDFAGKIYKVTKHFPNNEVFGLTSQLKRASVSIACNIAEGSGRYYKKDFTQFLRIARGSICECVPLLDIAVREDYITRIIAEELTKDCNELAKMINGLMRSLAAD